MADINWCKQKSKGIKLVEPNENLSKEYIESAEETLNLLKDIEGKSNMWLATTKYYCKYFSVYALLMKIGIKCEIHDCTIELCRFLEKIKMLPKGTCSLLKKDKELRIENQYYLKNKKVKLDYPNIVRLILEIKRIINSLTFNEIQEIRNKIRGL